MKLNRVKFIFSLIMGAMFVMVQAQIMAQNASMATSQSVSISTTEEGQLKLKVVKKEGNNETTFEKTYASHEDMMNDPELEKYGINPYGFGFGQSRSTPQFFFQNGPAHGFWNDDMKELRKKMQDMMRNFGSGSLAFDWDDGDQVNLDSIFKQLSSKAYAFDIDSLNNALQRGFQSFNFSFNDDRDEVKVIRRAKAVVEAASENDKKLVGTHNMKEMELMDLNFYPNPSDGQFDLNMKTKTDRPVQFNVVDSEGNEVFNRVGIPEDGVYRLTIDLSKKEKGNYILKMIQGKEALTKRIAIK